MKHRTMSVDILKSQGYMYTELEAKKVGGLRRQDDGSSNLVDDCWMTVGSPLQAQRSKVVGGRCKRSSEKTDGSSS